MHNCISWPRSIYRCFGTARSSPRIHLQAAEREWEQKLNLCLLQCLVSLQSLPHQYFFESIYSVSFSRYSPVLVGFSEHKIKNFIESKFWGIKITAVFSHIYNLIQSIALFGQELLIFHRCYCVPWDVFSQILNPRNSVNLHETVWLKCLKWADCFLPSVQWHKVCLVSLVWRLLAVHESQT